MHFAISRAKRFERKGMQMTAGDDSVMCCANVQNGNVDSGDKKLMSAS